jgi:L-2-hydroxyglutarate oxidase
MLKDCIAWIALRQDEVSMILFASRDTMTKQNIFDFAIVGAGLVGLATAWALKSRYPDAKLVIVEKESEVARHQSGRNSGVLHSGIYYKPGSLKAQLVARGRELILDFCKEDSIKYELCGKIILAVRENEFAQLEELASRGKENGLEIKILDVDEIHEIEPNAAGIRAIWVPQTGIVDFIEVARTIAMRLSELGVQILLDTKVVEVEDKGPDLRFRTNHGEFLTRRAVNCVGLFSDRLAKIAGTNPGLRIIPFRGEYFGLRPEARPLVNGLIYPLADPRLPFLGVHLTRTIQGEVLIGPNAVLAFKREGYHPGEIKLGDVFDWLSYPGFWKLILANLGPGLGEILKAWSPSAFTRATQRLVPAIRTTDMQPARAGVRAQAVDVNGKLVDDFRFSQSKKWFHVLNAPSPAATACLAIGERIAQQIDFSLN